MAKHRLAHGVHVIGALKALGECLGYHVELEFPVPTGSQREAPAVDVAWLRDKAQQFPMMIFEVESRPTNSMATNAMKVLAPRNHVIEKPLFFFHLVLAGGTGSSRVSALRDAYGGHNYRLYLLDDEGALGFLLDVLSQHRRLTDEIDWLPFYSVLAHDAWRLSRVDALRGAVDLGFSPQSVLWAYRELASIDPAFRSEFALLALRFIEADDMERFRGYFSKTYGVCAAMSIARAENEPSRQKLLQQLIAWQVDHFAFPSTSAPSRWEKRMDGEMMVALGGSVWTAIAACSGGHAPTVAYCRDQLVLLLQRLAVDRDPKHSVNAVWCAHLAAWLGDTDGYELARRVVARVGEDWFLPGFVDPIVNGFVLDRAVVLPGVPPGPGALPELHEFAKIAGREASGPVDPVELAVDVLYEVFDDGRALVQALWATTPKSDPT